MDQFKSASEEMRISSCDSGSQSLTYGDSKVLGPVPFLLSRNYCHNIIFLLPRATFNSKLIHI